MMLRVLTLSTLFPDATRPNFGVFVERQTRALADRSAVSVTVVAPIGLPPRPLSRLPRFAKVAALPESETWHGLDVHRPRFRALTAPARPPAIVRALTPLLDTLAFDVIDASFFFPDGPAAVALGKRYGVPVSIKARGADIHHWGRAPATARLVREAGLAANGLLAVSGAMRDDMAALGIPASRIRVHHTGIDHARFRPGHAHRNDPPHIVSLGALIPRKGHDIVIEAIATLPGVTLSIAGEGADRARLEALAQRLGVVDRVSFLGSIAHDALPPLLATADVMALASSSEGLANAWIEALACGTPIVITDAGGAREVVTSEVGGRVTLRDGLAFAAAIADILADPHPRAEVSATVAGFSWAANGAALHEHLANLVAGRQPSG